MLILLAGVAAATELLAFFPAGAPLPGEIVPLQVAVSDGTTLLPGVAPVVRTRSGALLGEPSPLADGRWMVAYQAPTRGEDTLTITADDARLEQLVALRSLPPSSLVLPAVMAGTVEGAPQLNILITGADLPPVESLAVVVGEGLVEEVRAQPGGIAVRWKPSSTPFARAVPIGVLDLRQPDVEPAWGVIGLTAHPSLPVAAEPGAAVTVTVGGRRYGPLEVGAAGVVRARIEVRPGEQWADVTVEDALGNTGHTRQTLGGDTLPRLIAVTEAEGPHPPRVYLSAITASGQPWRGGPPTCTTEEGETLSLAVLGLGRWSLLAPAHVDRLDRRVDCVLGDQAHASARIPPTLSRPTQLTLSVSPQTITSELPRARVQAFLLDAAGERLPAAGIEVTADRGEVVVQQGAAAVTGEYRGDAALSAGADVVRASWSAEGLGSGAVWAVELSVRPAVEGMWLHGRALDRRGLPVPDVPVLLQLDGAVQQASTDRNGWASARFPEAGSPAVASVMAGSRTEQAIAARGLQPGRDPAAPELRAAQPIVIRPGRIWEVFLTTQPRVLAANGSSAQVEIRLVDRSGRPVDDAELVLEASSGSLSAVRYDPQGYYSAAFTPDPEMSAGSVRITAATVEGGSVTSTDLEIVPRITRRLVGAQIGQLQGFGTLQSLWLSGELDWRPQGWERPLFVRGLVGYYRDEAQTYDDVADEDIALTLSMWPVGMGAYSRQEWYPWSSWLGMAVVLGPYYQETRFAGVLEPDASQFGITPVPGLQIFAGAGRRASRRFDSEVQLQVAPLFLVDSIKNVGWEGFVGGVTVSVGYKFINLGNL